MKLRILCFAYCKNIDKSSLANYYFCRVFVEKFINPNYTLQYSLALPYQVPSFINNNLS